ncbi:MAG TPA: aminotransferase class I/II-fold pyridoxal phosphate-dependent enzyme [Mycobacteriales bacterium]|nr:aminotransferase class I/II-fold pyridoxal phosphate-dependent enzyme [Mycobacteriales bacterium]
MSRPAPGPYVSPPSLAAAALPEYVARYGASVLDLDRAVAAAPGPPDLIDLTHGDTRAFLPPDWALRGFDTGAADNTEAYTAYRGSASVREVLAPRVAALLGRPVDAARELIVTPGSQGALFATLSALVGPGDVVMLADPDYFMNERITRYLGGQIVRAAPVMSADGLLEFSSEDMVRIAAVLPKVMLLSNPNNPLGGVYTAAAVEQLAAIARAADATVVVDQLYCRLIFGAATYTHLSALPGMAERTITLLGPSKTESMSGYRVGLGVGPPAVVDQMERVLSLASLRTGGYSQQVLRGWLQDDRDWLAERTVAHEKLRDEVVERLRAIPGVAVQPPAGSSYVFPDCSAVDGPYGDDDHALTIAFKQAGALVSPGYQFGPAGRGRFRINFSQDHDRLSTALDRITGVFR